MALTLSDAQYERCAIHFQAVGLIDEIGWPSVDKLLMTSTFGCIAQGVATGICIQHIMTYYVWQTKRDHAIARWGVAALGVLVLAQMAISHIQVVGLIKHYNRFTEVLLNDMWLTNMSSFCLHLIFPPVLLHFTFRAFVMWDNSMVVLLICLAGILPSFILGMTSFGFGLSAPWGFGILTDDQFQEWYKHAKYQSDQMDPLELASRATLLESTILLCFFVCGGVLRHRNGFKQMDSAVSRIAFLCGESLLPVVLVSLGLLIGTAAKKTDWGFLLLRVCTQLSPAVYFFALTLSLVARERVANILAAEPVRALPTIPRTDKIEAGGGGMRLAQLSPTNIFGEAQFDLPTINWNTLTAETLPTKFTAPDFVDMSKIPDDGTTQYSGRYSSLGNRSHSSKLVERSQTLPMESPEGMGQATHSRRDEEGTMESGLSAPPGIDSQERRRSSAMSMGLHEFLRRGPVGSKGSGAGKHRRNTSET